MDRETRFCVLFDRVYPALLRYARHRGLTSSDADDLVAGTLEVAWRRLDDVPADDPLPWLYVVAGNLLRNQMRRDRRRAEILGRYGAELLDRYRASPAAAGGDPAGLEPGVLRAALASLSEDDQEVLRLTAWDGLAPAQLAVVLGCTPVAARSRLHRARNRLAAALGLAQKVQRPVPARHEQGGSFKLSEVTNDSCR